MIALSVKVPKDIGNIITAVEETLYVEALNHVAFRRISYIQKQIEEYKEKIQFFESKYNKHFEDFLQNVPDSIEGHDDWIEWTYLIHVVDELSKQIEKLNLLKGR